MEIAISLRMTFLVLRHSLFPGPKKMGGRFPAPHMHHDYRLVISPEMVATIFADLSRTVDHNGDIQLFFPHTMAFAAPLILFRLKRTGFSSCRAFTDSQGILITARR